jgi:hypothetical protein
MRLSNWETLECAEDGHGERLLERLPVPGGWLVRSREISSGGQTMNASICFVPARFAPVTGVPEDWDLTTEED